MSNTVIKIVARKGEPFERMMRRYKKTLEREDIVNIVRDGAYFKKPSARLRQKKKEQAFRNMLRNRYLNQ